MVDRLKQVLRQPSLVGPLAAIGELRLQPAIRDIHDEHVLFTGDEVTGLIDFGALRIDTPLTDVARLMGSLVGSNYEQQQAALNHYAELRPLTEEDRRTIQLLDNAGVILSAANWLTWLYVERRDMGESQPIARRLDRLIQRLAGGMPVSG
jgi:homoserine kinase type II